MRLLLITLCLIAIGLSAYAQIDSLRIKLAPFKEQYMEDVSSSNQRYLRQKSTDVEKEEFKKLATNLWKSLDTAAMSGAEIRRIAVRIEAMELQNDTYNENNAALWKKRIDTLLIAGAKKGDFYCANRLAVAVVTSTHNPDAALQWLNVWYSHSKGADLYLPLLHNCAMFLKFSSNPQNRDAALFWAKRFNEWISNPDFTLSHFSTREFAIPTPAKIWTNGSYMNYIKSHFYHVFPELAPTAEAAPSGR